MAAELPEQAGEIRIIPFPRPAATTLSVHAEPARSCSQQIKLQTTLGAIGAPRRSRPPRAGAASPCEVLSTAAFRPSGQGHKCGNTIGHFKGQTMRNHRSQAARLQPMNGCRPSFIACFVSFCTCLVALKLRSLRFHSPRLCRAAVFLIQTNVSLMPIRESK